MQEGLCNTLIPVITIVVLLWITLPGHPTTSGLTHGITTNHSGMSTTPVNAYTD